MCVMTDAIVAARLLNQCITRQRHRRPADVVSWMGAVQAQEYDAAKWGIALRMPNGVDADIEHAFERGLILRTHVLRPTWHFVTPADIRWLLDLTAPRVHRRMAPYNRQLELDAATLARGTAVFERALRDRQYLTRAELGERLGRAGLAMAGVRLAHTAMYAELEGVICSGPRRGKQSTYGLVAERAPSARRLSRDEALAELTRRYFRSHGPATIRDFSWWSGLTHADARRGLEINRARRHEVGLRTYWTIGPMPSIPKSVGRVHLLPIYDEYLVAYRDREVVRHGPSVITSTFGQKATFQHALVIGGRIAGTWRTARSSGAVSIAAMSLRRLTAPDRRELAEAVDRYRRSVGVSVKLSVI
jgi:hypothetical protein